MQKALLIAEKNSLMNTIKDVYTKNKDKIPYEIDFKAQRGHLIELLMPDELDESLKDWSWDTLPFHPENYGGWQYRVKQEKRVGNFQTAQERFDEIKSAIDSGQYDFIINAGDPDQEGELLINLVLDKAENKLPVKRFWSNNLTDKNVLNTLQNLKDDADPFFKNVLAAAYARQRSDYRFGMNLSRAGTLKMGGTAAIGRVKTPILNIVVNREKQIRNFKEETMYGVRLVYGDDFKGSLFVPQSEDVKTNDDDVDDTEGQEAGIVWFNTKEEAESVIKELGNKSVVEDYVTKKESQKPPKLFKMVTAQNAAGKAFGYKTDQVDAILQELYEMKLLSYPRTDCEYIPSNEDLTSIISAAKGNAELAKYANNITNDDISRVKNTKKWSNDKEVDKAGHTALIPTDKSVQGVSLNKDQANIYNMVMRQFLSIFMPDLVQNKVEITTKNNDRLFRTTGKTLVDPGYTVIFNKEIRETSLPVLEKGHELNVLDREVSEKKTVCPKRFTSTSLAMACDSPLKYLEDENLKKLGKELKIGTPATRSGIIKELIEKDKYMKEVKAGKSVEIAPTNIGEAIINNLEGFDITKVDMTGLWEEELIDVRSGDLSLEDLESRMIDRVNEEVKKFRQTDMKPIPSNSKYNEIGICPKCGGKLIEGPKVFFCSNNKEKGCRVGGFKNVYGAEITSDEFLKMLNGEKIEKNMTYKNDKTGRISKWTQAVGVDENGTIAPIKKHEDTGWVCSACGKKIIETDRFYSCEGKDDESCGVFISKRIGEKDIPKEEFEKLFTTGMSGVIKGLKSAKKKGETYNAQMIINNEEKKIDLKFVEDQKETGLTCPVCGKPILETKYKYVCSGQNDHTCGFEMYNQMFKKPIPKKQVEELLFKVKEGDIKGGEEAFITKNGPIETDHVCPFCGDKIVKENMKFTCLGKKKGTCNFETYRNVGTYVLDDHEIDILLTAGKTEPIHDLPSKNGGTYDARAVLDWDSQKVGIEFVNEARESKYYCPICGEKLTKDGKKYTCSCGFNCWGMAGGRDLTEKEITQIFTKGETDYISNFKKKDGSKMGPLKIVVDRENKATRFVFKPNGKKSKK